VAGLTYWLASLYWLLLIPYRWHAIPLGPAAGWLALGAYLGLFPAAWVWLMHGLQSRVWSPESRARSPQSTVLRSGASPYSSLGLPSAFGLRPSSPFGGGLLARSWGQRTGWALSGAALWVALEMLLARLFTGFPWDPLGASQYRLVPLIQMSSITGVYGISFLLVWTSLSLLSAGLMIVLRPTLRSIWIGEIILPVIAVALAFHFGFRQLAADSSSGRTLRVTLVQPSIPQTLIWDTSRDLERFREVIQLSERALSNRTDLLIWPESAVPSYARLDTNIYPAITNLVQQHHVWLILGSDDLGWPPNAAQDDKYEYYNASFLVSPDGEFLRRYIKRRLVIFGEYVPLAKWLPFMKWFTPIDGGFTPGSRVVQFALTNPAVKTSTLICFEDLFPGLARAAAEDDTDFLVNLTNNGWFGESAAQWQHGAGAIFRAVENGLPLIRCSNNGLTCWVDAHGRLRQIFRDARGTIYGSGFMTVEIPLLARGEVRPTTYYHRHGDAFGWVCVGVAGIMLVRRLMAWRRAVQSA
jgi:apolipoprotein N-acyltransferase